jgi:serine/threonine protein kinase HipA of HipAB toxin-antitoxin module
MLATHNRSPHEVRIFEDANVLGDGRQGDRVSCGELGYGRAAWPELLEHPPADRMSNRGVDGIELLGRIFNHLVERTRAGLCGQGPH